MLDWIKTIAPYIVAIISLIGGVWVAVRNNKNQLTAAYFDRMTAAYERHWSAFAEFVYEPNDVHAGELEELLRKDVAEFRDREQRPR